MTGLVPPGRPLDARKRVIRVNVLGVAAPGQYDDVVAVACAALRDELAGRLPIVYGADHGTGFEIDEGNWRDLVREVRQAHQAWEADHAGDGDASRPGASPRVLRDTAAGREKVAAELADLHRRNRASREERDALPAGIVVLHSGIVDEHDLRDARPWRALCDVTPAESKSLLEHIPFVGPLVRPWRDMGFGSRLVIALIVIALTLGLIVFLTRAAQANDQNGPTTHIPPPRTQETTSS